MSRSYTSSPPSASLACSGTALALYIYIYIYIYTHAYVYIHRTECRGLVVNTLPALYFGEPGFKSGPGDSRVFAVVLSPSRQIPGYWATLT
jgi:hypothetical protein